MISSSAGPLFFNNFALLFQISVKKSKRPTISPSTRHLNYISISQFLTDLNMLPTHDAQSLHNSLLYTLDIHAPVINKTTILRPNTLLYTIDLPRQKQFIRMLESKWKKEKSSSSLTTYQNLKNKHCIDLINAKAIFKHDKFISMQHNSKLLFKLANSILARRQRSHTLTLLMMTYLLYLIPFSMTKSPILFHHYAHPYLYLSCALLLIHSLFSTF